MFNNISTYHSMYLFPQFGYEAVIKYALEDPDLEYKVKVTPLPVPSEAADRWFFTADELFWATRDLITGLSLLKRTVDTIEVLHVLGFAYSMVCVIVVMNIFTEREDSNEKAKTPNDWKV